RSCRKPGYFVISVEISSSQARVACTLLMSSSSLKKFRSQEPCSGYEKNSTSLGLTANLSTFCPLIPYQAPSILSQRKVWPLLMLVTGSKSRPTDSSTCNHPSLTCCLNEPCQNFSDSINVK